MKEKLLSEEQVLKKLKIDDFCHITKDKVIQMTSMLDQMEPEVAIKALEQFPEFANTTKEMVHDYQMLLDKAVEEGDKGIISVYEMNMRILNTLEDMLKKDDISFEEQRYILDEMKAVRDNMEKAADNHKAFVLQLVNRGLVAAVAGMAVLGTALGGKIDISKIGPQVAEGVKKGIEVVPKIIDTAKKMK